MGKNERRLIEYRIPLEEVSEESVREKSTRHGNISTIHIWWARKPLAASRAAIYASLVPSPDNEEDLRREMEFIIRLSKFSNTKNEKLMKEARRRISESFKGKRPKVLDPLSGAGTMPLESLRLGCESHSLEYNPVAVFLQKAYIENVLKFPAENELQTLADPKRKRPKVGRNLLQDFKKWSKWVEEEAEKELGIFYNEEDKKPIGFYWLRTVECQNPMCGKIIPLATNLWLANFLGDRENVALKISYNGRQPHFEVRKGKEIDFDASKGTMTEGIATCPSCGSAVRPDRTKQLANEGKLGQILAVVIYENVDGKGKIYRIAGREDKDRYEKACKVLRNLIKGQKGHTSLVPQEYLPVPGGGDPGDSDLFYNFLPGVLYGLKTWGDLFNDRQRLSLVIFIQKINEATRRIQEELKDREYARTIKALLALILGRLVDYNSTLCLLNSTGGRGVVHTFGRTALNMTWNYMETNPFSPIGANWQAGIVAIEKSFEKSLVTNSDRNSIDIRYGTATNLPYDNEEFDLVITDPPYYSSIPYSYLSDYFYVWYKRLLKDDFPTLFSTPLTPKSDEIIQNLSLLRGKSKKAAAKDESLCIKTDEIFRRKLLQCFKEIHRVLKADGLATIIFAHKSTEAWETLIDSLLRADLLITSSWPVQTEKAGRLRAQKSATLKSSVYFVCRKADSKTQAYFEDIKQDIKDRIESRLNYFWKVGIRGADFFVSAIGPAVEVFGKYKTVKRYSGDEVGISKLLEFVQDQVARYALKKILRTPPKRLEALTRFYLVWRWAYHNNKIPFDNARMLAQALGLEISDYTGKGKLIAKSGEDVKVRSPQERGKRFLEKPIKRPASMISVMHKAALFWKTGEKEKLNQVLEDSGFLNNERFWIFAQAVSDVLPNGDPEKKMLQGLLAGRKRIEKGPKPTKVTDFM